MLDKDRLLKEFRESFRKFLDDTRGESQLQIILRGHLYIESEILSLLNLALKHPKYILGKNFSFENKLNLAVALGLIAEENIHAYKKLNKIRNNFAHELGYELTEKDFNDFISTFSRELKDHYDYHTAFDYLFETNLTSKFRSAIAVLWIHLRFLIQVYEIDRRIEFYDKQIEDVNNKIQAELRKKETK